MGNLEGKGGHGLGGKCLRDKSVEVILVLMLLPDLERKTVRQRKMIMNET